MEFDHDIIIHQHVVCPACQITNAVRAHDAISFSAHISSLSLLFIETLQGSEEASGGIISHIGHCNWGVAISVEADIYTDQLLFTVFLAYVPRVT